MSRSISRSTGPSVVLLGLLGRGSTIGFGSGIAVGSPRVIGSTGSRGGPSGGVVSGPVCAFLGIELSSNQTRQTRFSSELLQGMCHVVRRSNCTRLFQFLGIRSLQVAIW